MWLVVILFIHVTEFDFQNIQVIAESLSEEEIKGLKSMFANMDTDKSGTITYEELKSGLARLGSKLSEVEVQQLMDAVSFVHLVIKPELWAYLLVLCGIE